MATARRIVRPPSAEEFTGATSSTIPRNHTNTGRTPSSVPTTHPSQDSARQQVVVRTRRKPGRQPMPRRQYVGTIQLADGTIAECHVTARGYGEAERKVLRLELVKLEEEVPEQQQ